LKLSDAELVRLRAALEAADLFNDYRSRFGAVRAAQAAE
jgi:hypothetical protein